MKILAHRGLWPLGGEPNSLTALAAALRAGYGVEFDVRDLAGTLVVSHDPPLVATVLLDDVVREARRADGVLAINVKAGGLHDRIAVALQSLPQRRWFAFDHSVPDLQVAIAQGLPCFARLSDLEPHAVLVEHAAGVWFDAFERDWIEPEAVETHLAVGRKVCLVSPELHGRPRVAVWEYWATWPAARSDDLMICTDFPEEAAEVFPA